MFESFGFILKNKNYLLRTAFMELKKRYAGSFIGGAWILIYPLLFLSMYVVVFQEVFKVRITGLDGGAFSYVVFVFSGLVPYLMLSETMSLSCTAVKNNIHFIRNVVVPIEIMPIRAALMSFITLSISLAIVLVLAAFNGSLGVNVVWLPLILLLQFLFAAGLALMLSCVAVLIPDVTYFINIITLMLMFVSPIGFTRDMVPQALQLFLYVNPVYYMVELYRAIFLHNTPPPMFELSIFTILALSHFLLGWLFFKRFKTVVVDYE